MDPVSFSEGVQIYNVFVFLFFLVDGGTEDPNTL